MLAKYAVEVEMVTKGQTELVERRRHVEEGDERALQRREVSVVSGIGDFDHWLLQALHGWMKTKKQMKEREKGILVWWPWDHANQVKDQAPTGSGSTLVHVLLVNPTKPTGSDLVQLVTHIQGNSGDVWHTSSEWNVWKLIWKSYEACKSQIVCWGASYQCLGLYNLYIFFMLSSGCVYELHNL